MSARVIHLLSHHDAISSIRFGFVEGIISARNQFTDLRFDPCHRETLRLKSLRSGWSARDAYTDRDRFKQSLDLRP